MNNVTLRIKYKAIPKEVVPSTSDLTLLSTLWHQFALSSVFMHFILFIKL